MKRPFVAAAGAIVLGVSACKESPPVALSTPEPELKDGHPVVHLPPVETRPFEDGYTAGFAYGKLHATPHSRLPSPEDAQRIAHDEAGAQPERTERWERGFAEGYTDGVRNVVTGQK